MTDKKEPIDGELVKVDIGPQAVMQTPKQLRAQMERDKQIREIINDYIKNNMVAGKDYGTIKIKGRDGREHESKPSLFKPGSEKFCGLFKIRPTFRKDTETVEMLGSTPGIIAYICDLVDGRGRVIGEGRGTAKADVTSGDFDINKQVKIAEKRAQIDAVLRTGGLSDFFTQDMEDAPKDFNENQGQVRPATIKQKNLISKLFMEKGASTPNLLLASIKENGVVDPKNMTMQEASDIIEKLFAGTALVVAADQEAPENPDLSRGPGDPDIHGYPGQEDEVIDEELSQEQLAANLEEAERELLGEDKK